ncbi:MAG TPA: transporter [Terriglobia bacterium]|nr:transporter [Terriglobia bacterium]
MRHRKALLHVLSAAVVAAIGLMCAPVPAEAQFRGLYTPGMNATNSGVLPEPDLTYSNLFQLYQFDQIKNADGDVVPSVSPNLNILIDQNLFVWVSKGQILGGHYAVLAALPLASSSLAEAELGALTTGAGFADTYYQPVTLGWHLERADLQVGYGFFAATGRFTPGATDNIGAGYWAHCPSAGQTFYLSADKMTAVSAYELYEFHTDQRDTDVHPGQTFNIDYSVSHNFAVKKDKSILLQLAFVGYGQYQTTHDSGASLTPAQIDSMYSVNALGGAANVILPLRKTSVGVKYFQEFANKSTVQGHSLQISATVTF